MQRAIEQFAAAGVTELLISPIGTEEEQTRTLDLIATLYRRPLRGPDQG